MTSFKDVVKKGFTEFLEELKEKLDGLTVAEMHWQASLDSNTIVWLVWHMARVEDNWISGAITGNTSVWDSKDWARKSGIEFPTNGYAHAMDEVRALSTTDVQVLVDYYDEVRVATFAAIDAMTDEDMNKIDIREGRDFAWSGILGHVIVEESQHLGQIAFIRGIIRGLDG
jgi:uncharacterized damage-inducible protein DinB